MKKKHLANAAVISYAGGCYVIGVFYLNFGFWKDNITKFAGIAIIMLVSLMLASFIIMKFNTSPIYYFLFKSFAVFLSFILMIACLCWVIYYGETYYIFSTRQSISFLGIAIHMCVLITGAYGIKTMDFQR